MSPARVRIFSLLSLIAAVALGAAGCEASVPTVVTYAGDSTKLTLAIGATGRASGVEITLQDIVEDSRCPVDVICVWAGNVQARVLLGAGQSSVTDAINTGVQPTSSVVGGRQVRIVLVTPDQRAAARIARSDYRVTFVVEPAR